MNLLADESVDAPIVWLLREAGHTVHYIAEMKPGVSDAVVLDHANRETCPLITADKDFGELVFRQRLLTHGVERYGWLGGIAARQGEYRAFGDS